eukprot:3997126-Pyramimonas_sp.AAC.1
MLKKPSSSSSSSSLLPPLSTRPFSRREKIATGAVCRSVPLGGTLVGLGGRQNATQDEQPGPRGIVIITVV